MTTFLFIWTIIATMVVFLAGLADLDLEDGMQVRVFILALLPGLIVWGLSAKLNAWMIGEDSSDISVKALLYTLWTGGR